MEKVTLRGEPIMLRTEAVQNVRSRCTSLPPMQSKYGALSVPAGKIIVEWAFEPGKSGERSLRLVWREVDGPPVVPPSQRGFGCFVLERVTLNALGEGKLEFNESGLAWTCIIRPDHLVDGTEAAAA